MRSSEHTALSNHKLSYIASKTGGSYYEHSFKTTFVHVYTVHHTLLYIIHQISKVAAHKYILLHQLTRNMGKPLVNTENSMEHVKATQTFFLSHRTRARVMPTSPPLPLCMDIGARVDLTEIAILLFVKNRRSVKIGAETHCKAINNASTHALGSAVTGRGCSINGW